jgi:hypothetical protein
MARSRKSLAPETIELLLLSKSMLDRIRALAPVTPDRHPVALNVLLAHDAAELALAAVAHHCEKLPSGNRRYLMDYFAPLKTLHPKTDVRGQGYFDQLNRVRVNLKHKGIFPEPNQWMGVAERVYEYLSGWCSKYLHITLDELDRSVLLTDQAVKEHYDSAKRHFVQRKYKEVMEELAWTLHTVLETKPALSGISVGQSDA